MGISYAIIFLLLLVVGVLLYRILKKPDTDPAISSLSELVKSLSQQVEHSRQATEKSERSVFQQVQSFTQNVTQLTEGVKQVQESVKGVSSFQEMFRSPKLRGTWGELGLEGILKEYFPRGGYQTQYAFKSGEMVDAVLKLPNGLFLPIDSKFSWENFQKMSEAEAESAKQSYRKAFLSDIKKRIDEIATKYILPSESTVDMALMYMPAESIYYEVIQNLKDDDVSEYARKRKVYLTSPNTLYITLTAVIHWFKDSELNKQTQTVMKRLEQVIKDANILANDFRKLGDHISDASSAYERSEKKLGHLVERTQNVIDSGHDAPKLQ